MILSGESILQNTYRSADIIKITSSTFQWNLLLQVFPNLFDLEMCFSFDGFIIPHGPNIVNTIFKNISFDEQNIFCLYKERFLAFLLVVSD